MATVYVNVDEYFATANPLARKISQDLENIKESYGDDWSEFSCEQQDKELWTNLVPPEISDKYDSSTTSIGDLPTVFPKLKILCGEKIVVDFDNDDGWTWTDEHSGPFSWRSRSQQDLSLFDDEPEHEAHNARNLRKVNHPKPPAAQTHLPEKSVRNAPFLASDKSASHNVDPDTLEIFQRFGITFGGKHEEEVVDVACGDIVDEDSDILSETDSDQDGLQLSPSKQRLIQPHTTQPHLIQPHTTQQHLIQPHTTYDDASVTPTDEPKPQRLIQPHTTQQGLIQPHTTRDDASVPATDEPRPVSPAEAASYSRDMQGYQTYFTEAYNNESSHHSAVTEQPKPVSRSPVPQVKQPKSEPKLQAPVTLTNNPKADPKTSSPVTIMKNPKIEPVSQPPATLLKDPELRPEPELPKQHPDTSYSVTDANTSATSQMSGFDFLDNW